MVNKVSLWDLELLQLKLKINSRLKYLSTRFSKLALITGSMFFLQNYFSQEQHTPFLYSENNEQVEIDTSSLENFHNYRINNEYLWLGNNGLANFSLIYNPNTAFNFTHLLRVNKEELIQREYNVYTPFTSAKYVQGARQEQYFEVLHTQNFNKQGNFSLGYKKINSIGSYNWQKSNNNNLFSNIWWKSKKENYKVSFFANRIKNITYQNGGLKNDSLFILDSSFSSNRKTFEVNLEKAKETQINNNLQLNQQVVISSKLDALGYGTQHKILFNTSFNNAKRTYFDTLLNTTYYTNFYTDSNYTKDNITTNNISQELAYLFTKKKDSSSLSFNPFINYAYFDYKQENRSEYYHNFRIGTNIIIDNKKLYFKFTPSFFLKGYQDQNTKNTALLALKLNNNFNWFFSQEFNVYTPSIDFQRYTGNHNKWTNNFDNIRLFNFSTGTNKNKFGVDFKLSYTDIYKPVYFNYLQETEQYDGYSQIIQTSLAKNFELGKWRIEPKAVYQYSGGLDIYRLPDYVTTLKIAYKFKAFKNKLDLYTGTKITYFGETELMSYSSSLGQFYLAPNPKTGNYPFVDFFVNGRIKNVRIFFALTHLNSGLFGDNNYFGAKNYPLEDRAYKIGINWNFLK